MTVPDKIAERNDLTASAKLVFAYIAAKVLDARVNQFCAIENDDIASGCGVGKRSVGRHTERLIHGKWIRRDRRGLFNLYKLTPKAVKAIDAKRSCTRRRHSA